MFIAWFQQVRTFCDLRQRAGDECMIRPPRARIRQRKSRPSHVTCQHKRATAWSPPFVHVRFRFQIPRVHCKITGCLTLTQTTRSAQNSNLQRHDMCQVTNIAATKNMPRKETEMRHTFSSTYVVTLSCVISYPAVTVAYVLRCLSQIIKINEKMGPCSNHDGIMSIINSHITGTWTHTRQKPQKTCSDMNWGNGWITSNKSLSFCRTIFNANVIRFTGPPTNMKSASYARTAIFSDCTTPIEARTTSLFTSGRARWQNAMGFMKIIPLQPIARKVIWCGKSRDLEEEQFPRNPYRSLGKSMKTTKHIEIGNSATRLFSNNSWNSKMFYLPLKRWNKFSRARFKSIAMKMYSLVNRFSYKTDRKITTNIQTLYLQITSTQKGKKCCNPSVAT
jgi:hypothetical protein